MLPAAGPVHGSVFVARKNLGIHGGGLAVAVARSTAIPPPCSRFITLSSHSKSKISSSGWMADHVKMPRLTMVTPASCIRATSTSTASGHCSRL